MNMNNKIPIDDLFREKLSSGKEQLNLGAWANMERMLDGKNPYQEKPENKRRIFPLFILLASLGVLSTAGVLTYQSFKNTKTTSLNTSESTNYRHFDKQLDKSISQALASSNIENEVATSNASDKVQEPSAGASQTYSQAYHSSNQIGQSSPSTSNTTRFNTKKKASSVNSNVISDDPSGLNASDVQHASVATSKKSNKAASSVASVKNDNPISQYNATSYAKQFDTVHQLYLKEKVSKSEDGKRVLVTFDTIKTAIAINERTINTNTSTLNGKYHPRYMVLSPEEEAANSKTTQIDPQIALASTEYTAVKASSSPSLVNAVAKSNEKSKKQPEDGNFNQKVKNTFQKLSLVGLNLLSLNVPSNPGIILGVNASIFGTQYNFGGFHAGFTNTIPVNETFSILTELKFFYKNNGGYTVKDYSTKINNTYTDTMSLASENKNVYHYQIDSSSRVYNFKNIMSLEMPIMLQAKLGNFRAFGGLNMGYNFRLNYKQSIKNEVIDKSETHSKSVPFEYPGGKGTTFVTDDFNARFGLGYALGAAYNFNQNLYVDMRVSNILWDNTKTNSSREISNATFKVPSLQLSIGYRFKNSDKK